MKLHLAQAPGQNVFTGYGAGYVVINGTRHEAHLLVTAERVVPWKVEGFDGLGSAQAGELIALEPEIVILGTGAAHRFPHPDLARTLAAAGIGLEVMDSNAACRTYNILLAEGRGVLAAILID